MSKLLIDEPPLLVLPSLAVELGIKQAIVLQQIHYLVGISQYEYEGKIWFYKSIDEWILKKPKANQKEGELRWLSKSTLERILDFLEARNLIIRKKLASKFGRSVYDRVTFFTINYEEMGKLEVEMFSQELPVETEKLIDLPVSQNHKTGFKPNETRYRQNDNIDVPSLTISISSKRVDRNSQNDEMAYSQNDEMITKNITKTTTEREPPSQIAPPDLFAVSTDVRPKFSMSETWQPSEQFSAACKFRGVNISTLSTDEQDDLINEFRSWWMTQNIQLNQAEWEHKLLSNLKRSQTRKTGTGGSLETFKGKKFSSAHGDLDW
ncbi:MAG: DnaT-like ssDNA-binding domain-containing protein [Pseudomonadales bacterium]|nr:DnaT-like ssDNA-binding domain-containing protein [Pseudomonadales bacterium]NRA15222.1 hypothetical protein [Oceanospirillaceae bacterium]